MDHRLATLDDVPTLARLNRQLTEDERHKNRFQPYEFFETRMRDFLTTEYDAVLFEDSGEIVAYALYTKYDDQSDTIYLRQFFVDRDRRRQGIGREAMRILKEEIWPKDKRLTVGVLWHNEAGYAFWKAVGYEEYSVDLEILPVKNPRTYGKAPFDVAVIHGGPGAGGEMAPVARELASVRGVLEPLQTATSLQGQVEELKTVLEKYGDLPVTLIGFSWGAWLSLIVAAKYPAIVEKLILVGSGPYKHEYAARIQETRLSRLDEGERAEYESIIATLNDPAAQDKPAAFARLGALASKTDAYDLVMSEPGKSESTGDQGNRFHGVLQEAIEMRRDGQLLRLARRIECPVVAIHGDHDPHPAEGVQAPLSANLEDFRFILLKNCGHKPWVERQARGPFYEVLKEELEPC